MTGLAGLVSEHFPALEADWVRYYGRDLASDLYGPEPMGVRRLLSLTRWLPPEAALWRSTGQAWDTHTELQATTVEMLDALLRAYLQVHSKKGAKQPQPVEIPRPWKRTEKPRQSGTPLSELIRASGMPVRRPAEEVSGG